MIDPQYIAAQKAEAEFKQKLGADGLKDDSKHADKPSEDEDDADDDEDDEDDDDDDDAEDEEEPDVGETTVEGDNDENSSLSHQQNQQTRKLPLRLASMGLPAQRKFDDIINQAHVSHHPIHSMGGIMPVQYLDSKVHKLQVPQKYMHIKLTSQFTFLIMAESVSYSSSSSSCMICTCTGSLSRGARYLSCYRRARSR
jgi:hypothetical protein